MFEKWNENDEGESIEQGGKECRNQADTEQSPIGLDEPDKPALSVHPLSLPGSEQSYGQEHLLR